MEMVPKLKAFVIGPIGDSDSEEGSPTRRSYDEAVEVLEKVINPACEANDLEVLRADQISRPGDIADQIFRLIRDSHVVIADLTGANPNVMYELGLRHTTGKLTIQIGEKGKLPFDVSTIRTIMFKRTASGFVDAKRSLLGSLGHALTHGADPVAATRIWFEELPSTRSDESSIKEESVDEPHAYDQDAIDSVDQPVGDVGEESKGFLEYLADLEESFPSLVASLQTTTAITEEVTETFSSGNERISTLSSGQHYSAERLKIANLVGAKLTVLGMRLRVIAGDLQNTVDRMDGGMRYLLRVLHSSDATAASTADADELVASVQLLADSAMTAHHGANDMIESVSAISDATRSTRTGVRELNTGLRLVADASLRVAKWGELIPAKLPSDAR